MRELKPDLIYVQQSGFGQSGRYGRYRTGGPIAQAIAGISEMSGLPTPYQPVGWGYSYLDWFGAYSVEVKFEVNGVPHTVRRDSENGELLMKIAGDDMRPCSEDDVRRLLPIQAYSQKQLSDVSVRVDELLRFITAPIRAKLDAIEERLSDRAERIKETYATVRRWSALSRTLEERQLAEVSLSEQVEALRAELTGLSEDDRALLDRGKVFSGADQVVGSWREGINTFQEDAESLRRKVGSHLSGAESPPVEPEREILREAFEEYKALLSDTNVSLDALINRADAMMSDPQTMDERSPWRRWSGKRKEFREAYDAAVQRSSAHRQQMEQLQAIEERHQEHVRETGRVREELRSLASADETHQPEREAWEYLIGERNDALDEHRTAGDQSRGTIAGEGAIDVDTVRDAIKRIMEGGEAAFNLRREKYGF